MANFIRTGLDTTQETLNDGETGIISEGGELIVTGAAAIIGSGNNWLIVNGMLAAGSAVFTSFDAYKYDGSNADIFVGTTGFIIGSSDGLDLFASGRVEVINHGTITADFDAITIRASDSAITTNILNSGHISGGRGVSVNAGNGLVPISNTGVISTSGTSIASFGSGAAKLSNTGVIVSSESFAILFREGADLVLNTGTISGRVDMGAGNDLFDGLNGVQTSDDVIAMGAGNDTFLGGSGAERVFDGSDEDEIVTGGGNDTIIGARDSADDFYDGGDGVDLVDYTSVFNGIQVNLSTGLATGGTIGVDQLVAIENVRTSFGDDTVVGSDVANLIRTGDGADRILGHEGRDRLHGGADNDTIDGGDGHDRLFGEDGDDRLLGDDGNDLVVGGLGRDALTGGSGIDTFAFLELADSGTTGGTRDRMTDFTQGVDKIDLSGIDANTSTNVDDAFAFIGTSAFSNTAGEVRFRQTATLTLVEMDVDGDGVADSSIRLDGVVSLVEGDFVL